MDDQDYYKKLESLQRYVPFLASMINELKAKGNREAQLTKFKSLYEMITDTKKRLKIETLTRCEEVLTSIYFKVNPQMKGGKLLGKVMSENSPLSFEAPRSTPQSPSPPRDVLLTKPVTIPTEKVVTATTGDNSLTKSIPTYQRPKIDVYSNVVLKPASPSVSKTALIDPKLPDMTKPPISLDDLKTLEDEVEQKINDAVYQSKSVDELQEVKKQLQLQLKVEEINSCMSSQETINTTVRNTPHLSKRRTSIASEEKSKDKKSSSNPIKEIKSPTSKSSKSKAEGSKVVKQCTMETDLFGNLLSSIDSKILEEKVVKKGDCAEVKDPKRRSSKDKKRDRDEKDKHHRKDKSRDRSSSSKSHKSHSSKSDKRDKQSSKSDTRPENSVTRLLEKEMLKTQKDSQEINSNKSPVTYKRLADKYNPKPKPKPADSVVDKTVTESIEQQMKTSPVKTIPPTILPPTQTTTDAPNKPVELPDILQKIIPKPTPAEVVATVAKQDPRLVLGSHSEQTTTKTSNITPAQQLNFEPPRFISPPRVPEPIVSPNIVLTNQVQPQRICPVVTPRMDFDSIPHPESQVNIIDQQFNVNRPFLPADPRQVQQQFVHQAPVRFMGQAYHPPPEYNHFDPRFYNNQFIEPKGYYPDRPMWGRDRRPGDPRNYREYREMKEKREAAQNKEIKDPRLASRDPRLSTKDAVETLQTEASIPKSAPPAKETEKSTKDSDKITVPKEIPRERVASSKFDKIYSKTNKSGTIKPGTSEEEESFMSPLDSLYNAGEKNRTGRGYGVQTFRIPKKSQRDDEKVKNKSGGEVKAKDKIEDSEKRKPPVIKSDSEESDADHADDVPCSVEDDTEEDEQPPVVENKCTELTVDTSRIKVVIDCKGESTGVWGDRNLKSPTCDEFVSEYDKELAAESKKDVQSEQVIVEESSTSQNVASVETEHKRETKEEPSVEQPQTSETENVKNEEPQEQNILAHFFENLLKSKNKKDKKTALFSLIETFSDSFDNKEIQKIRKIIKVNEDEEDEASDDDKESRCETPSVSSIVESKDAVSQEEVPVVGSTTGGEHDLTPELEKPETSIDENQTQVNEISKSGTDETNLTETQTAEAEEEDVQAEISQGEKKLKRLEPVMVSVGERTKSRKRQVPAKPKKRFRSELDHLHADIKDMFIRDGVLTASGKRMCRLLKDDPNALIKGGEQTATAPQPPPPTEGQPKKERKKPGPKPKPKRPVVDANSIKDMRVVLAKMPDDVMSSSSRSLRSRIMKNSYSEMDEDEITEAAVSSSLIDDDSETELDDESSSEESQIDKEETTQVEDGVTHKRKKRRKVARWAAGFLTKVKKKKPPSRLSNKSPTPEPVDDPVMSDFDADKLVEPDKDYYIDFAAKQKLHCKLCKFSGMAMTSHYLKEHPQSEVLSSRFAPAIASDAVKDFLENGSYWESIQKTKLSTRYQYCCRMCGYSSSVLPLLFYEHVTTHTGEYRHQCGICEFTAANSKTMASHFITTHPDQEKKTIKTTYTSAIIFAYMCGECNFVQLNRKSVEDHANIFHLGEKAAIFKVNMSTVLDPQLKAVAGSEAEKDSAKESPVIRKKPGPKSKTVIEKPAESEEVRVRKKPGPKSKTQKPEEIEESSETPKDAFTRKRKRSLDKLFSEDSGDDLDSIITLSIRSSRAAKEKATAKLKSLMESSETASSPTKRKSSPSESSEVAETSKDTQDSAEKSEVETPRKDTGSVEPTKPQRQRPNNVEELIPPMLRNKDPQSNPEDMNIFTCKNDIMQEETKKIEEERLQKMDELNKSIGSRTSNLDFINKLSNRLTQEQTGASEEAPVVIKSEPMDNDEPAPVLESQVPVAPSARKPVFEEEMMPAQPNITFRQDKPNSLFSNMIEKLQGKVNEAANMQEEDVPPDSPTASVVFSIGELIQVTKCNEEITFACRVPSCHVKTKDKTVFMLHCKFGHKAMTQTSCLCDKCGVVIEVTPDTTLMENLYDHLQFAHSDLMSEQAGLKMRRLSGDRLSIKMEENSDEQSQPEETVNEAPLQLAEDNPFSFKIANVMSLADTEKNQEKPLPLPAKNVPPLMLIEPAEKQKMSMVVKEAKQTSVEMARPKKAGRAMRKFIDNPGDLYKCPHFYCIFSTNVRTLLAAHLKAHKGNTTAMVRCVYCDMKTPWEHVPMHIDIRHANCSYSCSHCLYRAVSTEYVCLHMETAHFDKEYKVIALPIHKSSKKFAVTEQVDYKALCPPYQCSCLSGVSFNGDAQVVEFLFLTEFVNHLIKSHKNAPTVCGHSGCCDFISSTSAVSHWEQKHRVYPFQCAFCKFGSNDIAHLYPHFAQNHPNLSLDILVRKNDFSVEEFGYTDNAFAHLQHKKNLPPNLLTTIGKRGQRSIKLIQLSSPNAAPEFLVSNSLLKVTTPPKTVTSTSISSAGGIQPSQLILSSSAVLNKLFVATSTSGTGETLLLLSAPLIKSGQQTVQPITSTAPINKVTVQTSTASSASQVQSKEPVRLGNITLYPPDPSAVVLSAPTSTMISQPVALPTTPLFTTAPITQTPSQSAKIIEEDTTSQNTVSSEEDILQSAIRSILEEDGTLFSRPQSPALAERTAPSPPSLTLLNHQTPPAKNVSPPVEQVDLGNIRLDLEAQETLSNFSDDAFISSNSLDPFVEDPLSITPTLNVDLPPVESQEGQDSLNVTGDGDKKTTVKDQNPALITDMRRSVSNVSISDEESDGGFTEKKKRGLIGRELFRCFGCHLTFSNVKVLRGHLKASAACKKSGPNSYKCVHCDRWLKTVQRLCDHIMTHGVQRFSCSLCEEKFTIVQHAKLHMKTRHGISGHLTSLVPLKADQVDLDLHEFILKPAQATPLFKVIKANGNPSETNSQGDDCTYTPDQINSIPIRQIFNSNVKCGLCNYQTKVRVNIIRHLQMHLDEKAVPDTAPVNPVPCLEKNEKMFDKMINLAASSITTTSRMGGPAVKDREMEEEKYPEFVPSHRRYVCCAAGCSYLCPEEGNLKHHVMALHSDESAFTCAHCQTKIETSEIDTVIKHFKLHGLTLYKCQSCSFIHNLKHKVERHITDTHLDVSSTKVITIRTMDSEPVEAQEETGSLSMAEPSTSKFKPWSCCMCKVKYHTQQEIQSHVAKKHNIDAQYKCTLCSFKNDDEDSCREHFKATHPTQEFDVVLVYQKLEEEVPKDDVAVFDTTPLWQRDKPRVRHIRGILFEDVEPLPHSSKSPKKKVYPASHTKTSSASPSPAKTQPSPVAKTSASVTATSESCSKNLFDCIDAVARGTVDTSVSEPGPSGLSSKKVSTPMASPKDDESTISKSSFAAPEDTQPPDDDDVILLPTVPNVIVIDSDDSDSESNSQPFVKLLEVNKTEEDDIPKTKDKDSKTKPLAKNRTAVKRPSDDIFTEGVKIAKIDESTDDQSIAEACNKNNLIKLFGPLGTPFNKQWKCPKCNHFKSKIIGDFVFHMYKEFNRYRYYCQLCQDKSITYKYMLDHVKLHPNYGEEVVDAFPLDPQLDAWIHMVVREQSLQILDKAPLFRKLPSDTNTVSCYFCQSKFISMTDCCEHMLYHWVMMPYQCQHCRNEFYTVYDLRHHHKVEHHDAKLYLTPKGPTISKALQCIESFKKNLPKKPANSTNPITTKPSIESQPAKKPRLEGEDKSKRVIVLDDPEESITISPQTETVTVNPDEVFACKVCVFFADSQEQIQAHLTEMHRTRKARLFHVLSKEKSDRGSVLKYSCNMCDEIATELKLRVHFMKSHPGSELDFAPYKYVCSLCDGKFMTLVKIRHHFGKSHPGEGVNFKTVSAKKDINDLKQVKYSCPYCSYVSIVESQSIHVQLAIKTHLKGHLRPVACELCKTRFRYDSEVTKHYSVAHPGKPVASTLLTDVFEEYVEVVKKVIKDAIVQDKSAKVNKVARKSTSAMCPKATSELDMTKIVTTFEMENLEYTTTAEQLMKMFNMNTYVDLSGCWVDVVK